MQFREQLPGRVWVSMKQVITTRLPAALLDELRDCVVAQSGPPHRLTVSTLLEIAVRRELVRRRRGKRFPKRRRPVRAGRPIEA